MSEPKDYTTHVLIVLLIILTPISFIVSNKEFETKKRREKNIGTLVKLGSETLMVIKVYDCFDEKPPYLLSNGVCIEEYMYEQNKIGGDNE